MSEVKKAILNLLLNAAAPMTTKAIGIALGMLQSRTRAHLYELRGDGLLKRDVKARTWDVTDKVEYRKNTAEPVVENPPARPEDTEEALAELDEKAWADLGRPDDDADLDAAAMREDAGLDDDPIF